MINMYDNHAFHKYIYYSINVAIKQDHWRLEAALHQN